MNRQIYGYANVPFPWFRLSCLLEQDFLCSEYRRFLCILFVFYESFIPFMMHCLWSKCQSSMIVCPTSVCVHYVLVAWWIPNDYNLTTCVYFIRLKLDLSCHLHVKHPLLLGVCVAKNYFCCLYLRECLFWIWCTQRNGPGEMASVWFELSNKAPLTS